MKIEQRRSTFSQFSADMWLTATHNGTEVEFDLKECEIVPFVYDLLDIAVDCLLHAKHDTGDIDGKLCEAMELLNIPEGEQNEYNCSCTRREVIYVAKEILH